MDGGTVHCSSLRLFYGHNMLICNARADSLSQQKVAVCIIGGGAAGIALACELADAPFSVLLLEAGGLQCADSAAQRWLQGTAAEPHANPGEYRRVGLGGTTSIWGGRCVPLDPIDFERREHVPHSGWPMSYDELAAHYPAAMAYCHAGNSEFTASGSLAAATPMIEGVASNAMLDADRIERYSLPTHFGKAHRARLRQSDNVTVALGLRCVRLQRRLGDAAIESIDVVDAQGHRATLRAQVFVLAMGGVESTRLLLASDPDGPGLGNHHDLLGRYYSCHFDNICAKLVAPRSAVAFDFERTRDGVYCRRKLQFTARAQRRYGLLNAAFRLHFPEYSDASHGSAVLSAIYLAKSFLLSEYQTILQHGLDAPPVSPRSAHLRNVLLRCWQLPGFALDWLIRRQLAYRKLPYTLIANADGSYPLEFNSEQIPLASSRIRLGSERDAHGLPQVHIDWRLSEEDVEASVRAFRLLREQLGATGQCTVVLDEASLPARLRSSVPVGGHHIGTARMAASAHKGVVDQNCALFEARNLYLATSAVFPTPGHANPTLSIVALSIRLAAHLRASLSTPLETSPAAG